MWLSRQVRYYRAMANTLFTVCGFDPTLQLDSLPAAIKNVYGVLAALTAVRKMQASGLQRIEVVSEGKTVSVSWLDTLANETIREFIAKATEKDLLEEYESTRGDVTDPRTAPLLAELKLRSIV